MPLCWYLNGITNMGAIMKTLSLLAESVLEGTLLDPVSNDRES